MTDLSENVSPHSEADWLIRRGGQNFRAPNFATIGAWRAEGRLSAADYERRRGSGTSSAC